VILFIDPERHFNPKHERTMRTAEEYEWQRLLREADELHRAQRKGMRKPRRHRYLQRFTGHTSLARP
jgi:hypothetical protein